MRKLNRARTAIRRDIVVHPLLSSEPTSIGDYRLQSRLGRGAMGAVYLGRSRGGRMVAVKLVRSDLADNTEFRERFRREVEAARSVGGFWTAAVVDADPDAEQPWLATEYVPGPTLHNVVAEHGPLPEHTVRNLAAGLAEALEAIHRAGLIHRDLKPANVLLGPDGPRVIDFGISRAMAASSMTATGMFMGTPGFFSPEQTSDDEVGPPSDVFSLGAVLAFAATGNSPFGNESTPVMLYRVVHSAPDLSGVPNSLLGVVTACLNKNPTQRPTTADILDMVGEVHPEGNHWLPSAIKAAIDEHTERVRLSMITPDVTTPVPGPLTPSPPRSGARVDTPPGPPWPGAPTPPGPPRTGTRLDPPQGPPSGPPRTGTRLDPKPLAPLPASETTDEMPPVRPMQPPMQMQAPGPSWPSAPALHRDTPGPEFRTGGRVGPLIWAVLLLAVVCSAFYYRALVYFYFLPYWQIFQFVVIAMEIGSVLALLRAALPSLRMKISGGGLRISRLGLSREIPWHHVERIGLVGHGRRQAVAVWAPGGANPPEPLWWHWVRDYHGGVRVFPIGATGSGYKRRREADRVRLALQQYTPRRYDNRLL